MAQLITEDLVLGNGAEATAGQKVTVHYTGWLTNGTKFDSSKDRRDPFVFSLGRGQVIKGWDQGVQGMKVGGKRKLTIPPEMGYGSRGARGVIPPHAGRVFAAEVRGAWSRRAGGACGRWRGWGWAKGRADRRRRGPGRRARHRPFPAGW